jgi:hypothetical protein
MWWVYLLVFFGGAIVGVMLMALMAALPKDDRVDIKHEGGEVHISRSPEDLGKEE